MHSINTMTFQLTEYNLAKLKGWTDKKNLNLYAGSLGGRFTYSFRPTSLGAVVTVTDCLEQKDTVDLTEYEAW